MTAARMAAQPAGPRRTLPMIVNSITVIGGKVATMGLGFLFWVVAARMFSQHEVGLAGGVVSAMMLCTQIAILGVGSALITRYPTHAAEPRALFDNAISLTTAAAFLSGLVTLLLAAIALANLSLIAHSVTFATLFIAACVTGTLGILLDQSSIALRRGDQVLSRGMAFGVVSLGTLAVIAWGSSHANAVAIFFPWVVAGVVSVVMGIWQLHRSLEGYRVRPGRDRMMWGDLTRVGVPNWALTMTERTPGLVLPIVVTEVLSPADNAVWYSAWMMAWVLFVVPISVGLTLFAEATNRPDKLRRAVRVGLGTALGIGIAGGILMAVLAPYLLRLLGSGYAADGVTPLRILIMSVIPLAFTQAYFSICRTWQRLGEAITIGAVSAIVSIVAGGVAGAKWGLVGMASAWTITQTVIGAISLQRMVVLAKTPVVAPVPEGTAVGR